MIKCLKKLNVNIETLNTDTIFVTGSNKFENITASLNVGIIYSYFILKYILTLTKSSRKCWNCW